MAQLNPHFADLKRAYVFPIIEQKLADYKKLFPNEKILNFGVGDIALPIASAIVEAMTSAIQEMGQEQHFRGYGPSEGYAFLKKAITENEYAHLGIAPEEIFISDGINSDVANMQEIFDLSSIVGIPDPTYPVYLDTNIIAGRERNIRILPCTKETHFVPTPPLKRCDFAYLCSPNNPTGEALTREELAVWIDWANKNHCILILDHAYAAFVTSPDVPRSIYEIPGAHRVAIECKSFSKSAGFTGLRCAYTVVPKSLERTMQGAKMLLHTLWMKRTHIKSNGVSYPVQRAAEAVYSSAGKEQTAAQVALYLKNARMFKEGLEAKGFACWGGKNSPYIWCQVPEGMPSWDFFDRLLERCKILCIPGSGFGTLGEGYIRFSSFTSEANIQEALNRLSAL